MRLNELAPAPGAKKKKKRVGRGPGGTDKTSGRGHKGYGSRSGSSLASSGSYKSEGGQTPMIRRLPKRGFNHVGEEFHIINIEALGVFSKGEQVTAETLIAKGLLKKKVHKIKLLGRGEIESALTIKVDAASSGAIEKIKKAGGQIEVS